MQEKDFRETIRNLSMALIDDFRGFLVDRKQRIEVPEGMYHLQIAYQEMQKVPGWKYESGTGQNATIEYMKEKDGIYITKILKEDGSGKYQRTVGYLKDSFLKQIEYRGKKRLEYEVLREIAIGMGYDVDEYTLLERTKNSVKTPVSLVSYKGKTYVTRSSIKQVQSHRNLSEGDKPVFGKNGRLMGFMSNGKFVDVNHYKRYTRIHPNEDKKSEDFDEI
ncbi:MAG: hypothetical protein J6D03_04635 [Clostridia bacterium]|nr:hypothetical protein [Clostridia bacterium]HBC85128.1 hypothetical protein [Clostridiales bacterium]